MTALFERRYEIEHDSDEISKNIPSFFPDAKYNIDTDSEKIGEWNFATMTKSVIRHNSCVVSFVHCVWKDMKFATQ